VIPLNPLDRELAIVADDFSGILILRRTSVQWYSLNASI
jgi:hypothetical protein